MSRLPGSVLLGAVLLAGCRSPVARSVAVIPLVPPGTASTFDAGFSDAAALRVWQEVDRRGFAAILEDASAVPESCVLARRSDVDADLRIFVWVQVVDLPQDEYPQEAARTWGGLGLIGRDGEELSRGVHLREDPERPSSALYRVADAGEPAAQTAAEEFGGWVLASIGEFRETVRPILAGGA